MLDHADWEIASGKPERKEPWDSLPDRNPPQPTEEMGITEDDLPEWAREMRKK